MYREYPKSEPIYFGPPSPEIDMAWRELLYGAGVDHTGEEAANIKDITWKEPQGGLYRTA